MAAFFIVRDTSHPRIVPRLFSIGRDGTIGSLQIVSGHPWLTGAALEAVRQWRYRPHTLDGEPVEVDTFITVRFTLSGN